MRYTDRLAEAAIAPSVGIAAIRTTVRMMVSLVAPV
jgi:hypothetical protein